MKTQEIDTMSKKEEELVDVLRELGYNRGTAKTLVYMLAKKTAHTKDIERAMDLRQPEVSIGAKELRRLGILSTKDVARKRKGRPIHLYTLKSASKVKDLLIKGMREEIKKIEKNIEILKTLIPE